MAHAELADRLTGQLLEPGDRGDDEARRGWNSTIERRPSLITRWRNAADDMASVIFCPRTGSGHRDSKRWP